MQTYIIIHVVLSLIGILSGFVIVVGLLIGKRLNSWTFLFLGSTLATSVTGFGFLPFDGFTPAQAFGVLSVVLLTLAIYARYSRSLEGGWRKVYIITALTALYLNAFVGIVQAFQKIPDLKSLGHPPFVAAQVINVILFIVFGFVAIRHFPGGPGRSLAGGELGLEPSS